MIKISIASIIVIVIVSCSCTNTESVDVSFKDHNVDINADDQTLQSIQKLDGLYLVNYHGDYENRIKWLHEYHQTESASNSNNTKCSLFAAYTKDGKVILGRNFDRSREIPILGKFSAPGKYKSFAFSPASEVYLNAVLGISNPSEEQRNKFLYCLPFYATDGINEKGLAIAIAGAPAQKIQNPRGPNHMFVLYFIRQVLDNCESVEEVARLADSVSLYDSDYNTISHHFLVTDANGRWLVIDYPNGKLRLSEGVGELQIRTNHFIDGGQAIENSSFARYDKLYRALNSKEPLSSGKEAMKLLKQVRNGTKWSVVYESNSGGGIFAVQGNYNKQYRFGFSRDYH